MGLWEKLPYVDPSLLFSFADDSCPRPPKIANGYVEHSVRYGCKRYYKLRTEGDGKSWRRSLCALPPPAFPPREEGVTGQEAHLCSESRDSAPNES